MRDITQALVHEHKLILRMLAILETNSARTEAGTFSDWQFYLDAVDFVRNYADRFHHAKEEDVLFEALVKNGMPREHSPVAAMLMEHEYGRSCVRAMEEAAGKALKGEQGQEEVIAENARNYLEMLREHIQKEDQVLYPLAERIIPRELREEIVAGYGLAEQKTPPAFEERYLKLVERYESYLSKAA